MIKRAICIPNNLSFTQWIDGVKLDLYDYVIPVVAYENNWWKWVESLYIANNLVFLNAPLPSKIIFPKVEDWRKWASFFVHFCLTN